MRRALLLAALLAPCLPAAAGAQGLPQVNRPGGGIVAQPLPPPSQQPPSQQSQSPGQVPPAAPAPPGAAPAAPAPPIVSVPTVRADDWVPQGTAELRGIDKVMARTTRITVKVGEPVRFGPLSIVVRACVVHPPDQAPDAAAFLEVGEPGKPPVFRGWMILSAPQLALVEHPTHDVRIAGCRP